MQATEDLKHEHRIIELVLAALEHKAERLESGHLLNRDRAERALEILRNFADKCHHGKEERHLFPMLESRGVPRDSGPIGVLLHEHVEGRNHVRAMARAATGASEGDPQGGPTFVRHALAYVTLLRQHIQKEEQVLFPMAEQMLGPADDATLMAGFEQIERDEVGEGVHEKYHRWAHDLIEESE